MKKGFVNNFLKAVEDLVDSIGRLDGLISRESLNFKLMRSAGIDPHKVYYGYKNLEKRGLIRRHGDNYNLTPDGQKWYKNSRFKYFKIKNKKWDGRWRVIIFDIPQEFHNERNSLRKKLKNLGFYMLQKSVFVFPYPCEEELGDLCSSLNIDEYIDILVAESVGFKTGELKKLFNL